MPVFSVNDKTLKRKKEVQIIKEKEIQAITEANLKTIFNLEFIKSEFIVGAFRLDTLAFDEDTGSFVIIEYKKAENESVIDQGYSYLSLLLNRETDFIYEYYNKTKEMLTKGDTIKSPKVIFISSNFTKYQKQAINMKDIPIELWELKKYEDDVIEFNQIKPSEDSVSINKISNNMSLVKNVNKIIEIYDENYHLNKIPDSIKELYEILKEKILNMDDRIDVKINKTYIAFVLSSNIVAVKPQHSQIKLWLNLSKGELNDPENKARDISNLGHLATGAYEINLSEESDLKYLLILIEQAYKKQLIKN